MRNTSTAIVSSQPIAPQPRGISGVLIEPKSFTAALDRFYGHLQARNCSSATLKAYRTDVAQLATWLKATYSDEVLVDEVLTSDIEEFLAFLASRKMSGVSMSRKLAAIREFFSYLEMHGLVGHSPAARIPSPKREQSQRTFLHSDEYSRILALAGANARDFALLQLLLQTGIRVGELCALEVEDVDLEHKRLKVRHGKGQTYRELPLEKKSRLALERWLEKRGDADDEHLFLNRYGLPLSDRGVRKLVTKYSLGAGNSTKATPHTFRHTFITHKIDEGVNPFDVQKWAGHAKITTTQGYVHQTGKSKQKIMEATSL
jgi:site-specific recombinase XerD